MAWPASSSGRAGTLTGAGTGTINLDFHGPEAGSTSPDEPVSYSLDFSGALLQGNWQLAPKSPWSGGLRYLHAQVDAELRNDTSFDLAGGADVTISAPAAILEFDNRDELVFAGGSSDAGRARRLSVGIGRDAVVAAAGYGATHGSGNPLSNSKEIGSGALGFRYELARAFGLHAGMDLGFSSETTALYFQLGNAWFRP